MKMMDIIEDLMNEVKHLQNVLDIIEIGVENCGVGDHKNEVSMVHVVNNYINMIKTQYIEKLAESLNNGRQDD